MTRGRRMEHVHLDSILEEGRRLYRQGGFEAMTLRNVARSLGCSPSALYYHIGDVEDLRQLVAELVLKECARALRLPLKRSRETSTPLGQFKVRLERYRRFWTQEPQALDLVFRTTGIEPVARQAWFAHLLVGDLAEAMGPFDALGWWARLHGVVVLECTRIVDATTAFRLWVQAVGEAAKAYEAAIAAGPYEPNEFDLDMAKAA